jgi:hypothetical protein
MLQAQAMAAILLDKTQQHARPLHHRWHSDRSAMPFVTTCQRLCRYSASKSITPSVVALCYLLYAMNAGTIRAMLGLPRTSASDLMDTLQPAAAVLLLFLNLLRTCW